MNYIFSLYCMKYSNLQIIIAMILFLLYKASNWVNYFIVTVYKGLLSSHCQGLHHVNVSFSHISTDPVTLNVDVEGKHMHIYIYMYVPIFLYLFLCWYKIEYNFFSSVHQEVNYIDFFFLMFPSFYKFI